MDRLSKEHRSWNMSRIKSRDTTPERMVRHLLHELGFRFRLSSGNKIFGKPDVVLPRHRTVIFVHGCFWHRHARCKQCYSPKSRIDFWQEKFAANIARDKKVKRKLRKDGWKVITIWECQLSRLGGLSQRLQKIK